jgi:hypothetical protein
MSTTITTNQTSCSDGTPIDLTITTSAVTIGTSIKPSLSVTLKATQKIAGGTGRTDLGTPIEIQHHALLQRGSPVNVNVNAVDTQLYRVTFPKQSPAQWPNELVFTLKVIGIEHSPVEITWKAPPVWEALKWFTVKEISKDKISNVASYSKKTSLFRFFFFFFWFTIKTFLFIMMMTMQIGDKVNRMKMDDLALLVKYHAYLGNITSLSDLSSSQEVDLSLPCPMTKQNILHVALTMENAELMRLGLHLQPQLLDQPNSVGKTPRQILKTPAFQDSACYHVFAASAHTGFHFFHLSSIFLPSFFHLSSIFLPSIFFPFNSDAVTFLIGSFSFLVAQNPDEATRELTELLEGATFGNSAEEKKLIEDIKLQGLLDSQLSLISWKDFLQGLQNNAFTLSNDGATRLVTSVAESFSQETSPTSQRNQSLLAGLTSILESHPPMAVALNTLGPKYISEKISLVSFVMSPRESIVEIGTNFARNLVEVCPAFRDWTSFLRVDGAHKEAMVKLFSSFTPTGKLYSREELSKRLQKKLSDILLETTKTPSSSSSSSGDDDQRLGESQEDLSSITYFTDTIKFVIQKLFLHQAERQKEILDQAETLALTVIRQIECSLSKAYEVKDTLSFDSHLSDMTQALQNLVTIQRERRARRAARYREKVESLSVILPNLQGEMKILVETFLNHTDLHRRAVENLEHIYNAILSSSAYLNPAKELRLLDSLIGELYAISISLVITGPISVGKSTIVNCIVGENISPNRTQTMTAIPLRYLHDPTAETPKMLVPFADQLNVVLDKIRTITKEDPNIKALLRKTHLVKLLDAIDQGLEISSIYTGIPEIREASTNIHDLFRLAVDEEVFGTSLVVDLPLDWSQGLDTYLTVNLKFPGLDILSGLVEFSVVDTPGINEDGVKKLRLDSTIRDTLQVCKYAVLVTTPTRVGSLELASLKSMFHEIKGTLKTPVMAYITFSDELVDRGGPDAKMNISNYLTAERGERIFETSDIFLVLANRKVVGSHMLSFIEKHKRKPKLQGEDPEAEALAKEWTHVAAFGDTPEEKNEYYEGLSLASLVDRSKRLVALSNMNEPLHRMAREALANGIPTSVRHCILSAMQRVDPIVKKLACTTRPETIKAALLRGTSSMDKLVQLQSALRLDVGARSERVKKDIKDQRATILKEINAWTSPLHLNTPTTLAKRDFFSLFLGELKARDDQSALSLVTGDTLVSFPLKSEAEKNLSLIEIAFRKAIETRLLGENENVAKDLKEWGNSKKAEVRSTFTDIARIYGQVLNLKPRDEVIHSMKVPAGDPKERLAMTYDSSIQRLVRQWKKKGPAQLLSLVGIKQGLNSFTIDPADLRRHLVAETPLYLDATESVLLVQVDSIVSRILKPFVEDSIHEVLRLQTIVKEQIMETDTRKTHQEQVKRNLASQIGETLAAGQMILISTKQS